jgi:hypothetical protein
VVGERAICGEFSIDDELEVLEYEFLGAGCTRRVRLDCRNPYHITFDTTECQQ